MSKDDTIHCVSLVFGVLFVTILFMMKVTQGQGENRNPCALAMANAVDKQKGRCKMAMYLTWDGIHHAGSMGDGI
jgi:hypothetical protein